MLNQSEIDTFQREGVVVLRNLFADWVPTLIDGVEKNLSQPSPLVRDYYDEKGGRFFGDYCSWDRIPEYRNFLFNSTAADIAGALMVSNEVRLFHEHVLVKEPGAQIPTPWHQDQPYYCVDGEQNCSLWLALDAVPQESAVEFIAGSHRWGKSFRPERFDRSPLYENDVQESLPDIDNHRDDYEIRSWSLQPGDVVAFHFMTVHGAPPNNSNQSRRRGFSSRWVGADARFAVRQGKTSPPFSDCQLKHGDILNSPEFPLLRPVN